MNKQNKKIAQQKRAEERKKAEKNAAETLAWRFSGHFSGGTCRMYGTGDLGRSFFSVS